MRASRANPTGATVKAWDAVAVFTYDDHPTVTALEVQTYLGRLREERVLALAEGLGGVPTYMEDLDGEIAAAREALVAMAVTEAATLRGELFGRQAG